MTSLQFDKELPSVLAGVVPILKEKLRAINTDPHNKKEEGLVPIFTPWGEILWVHPGIIESQKWTTVPQRKFKDNAQLSFSIVVSISTRESEEDVASLTGSGEEESVLAADIGTPSTSKIQSGKQYLKQYGQLVASPS